jgi:type I restriction enzyme M protein
MSNNDIVQKLWNLCDVLRDDGINYSDYVTELVLLLFIKMVHENTEAGVLAVHTLPIGCRWDDLSGRDDTNLLASYRSILIKLSTGRNDDGEIVHSDKLLLAIYKGAQTRLSEQTHLAQLIKALDQIDWFSAKKDGLGDLYEGLLEKNAEESKSGAGQYFTPRALIDSIVKMIDPKLGEVIQDPAAGTAGFLIAADRYIKEQTADYNNLSKKKINFQKNNAFVGVELVSSTQRLALMNCLLHGLEGDEAGIVQLGNSLSQLGADLPEADIVIANPPFGTSKGGDASITRIDLPFTTSNKQLAFLQHIYLNLKPGGRAAVVLPDNVLTDTGIGTKIRRDLMNRCNLHTIIRLPTGIFYAAGVKTNVLFFSKGGVKNKLQEESCTKNTWVYDLRTNMPSFGKRTPFGKQHLMPFESVYTVPLNKRTEGEWSFNAETIKIEPTAFNQDIDERLAQSRWRVFNRKYIRDIKGDSLDISWLKDTDSLNAENLDSPEKLAFEAKRELEGALAELDILINSLALEDIG